MKRTHNYPVLLALVFGLLWGCGSSGGGDNQTSNANGSGSSTSTTSTTTTTTFIKEFSIPPDQNGRVSAPYGLTVDNQKQIWFAAEIDNPFAPDQIGVFDSINETFPSPRIIPGAPNSTSPQPPVTDTQPRGLAFDPATGDFWFTESGTSVIGQVHGLFNIFEYPVPTQDSRPLGITIDPTTGWVWFTENASGKIGQLKPLDANSGTTDGFTEYPGGIHPTGIAVDSQQNIWFTDPGANQLGELDVSSGVGIIKYFPIPTPASNPNGIAIDSQDRVWFTETDKNKIGRFDPTATPGPQFEEYPLPNNGSSPSGIAIDPGTGVVWFTEFRGNRIGRLDPTLATPGTSDGITEFQIPTPNSGPTSIVIDADKVVWFSETTAKKIGKLTPP